MNIFKKISKKITEKKLTLPFIILGTVLFLSVIVVYFYNSGSLQRPGRRPKLTSRPGSDISTISKEDKTKQNLEKLNKIISEKMKKAMEQIQPEVVYQKYISKQDLKLSTDVLKNRSKGSKVPRHRMVVFMDFACGICSRVSNELKQRLAENKDRLQMIYVLFPLDKECNPSLKGKYSDYSCFSAELALCSEKEGKFFDSFDYLYKNRPSSKLIDKKAFMKAMSKDLDLKSLKDCMNSSWLKERMLLENKVYKDINVPGTPYVVLDGKHLSKIYRFKEPFSDFLNYKELKENKK